MAICKRCGCAIPLGSKSCDMCATTAAIAPSQSSVSWSPPPASLTQTAPPAPAPALQLRKAQKAVRGAWQFIAFIGVLAVVLGAVAELGNIDFLLTYFDWYTAAEGMVFLVLAFFIRRGSLVAFGIAVGLYALDTVALFLTGHLAIVRIAILFYLLRAVASANLLRKHRKMIAQQATLDQTRAA